MQTTDAPSINASRWRSLACLVLLASSWALSSCGGSADMPASAEPPASGGPITSASVPHAASLDAIATAYAALDQTDNVADAQTLLELVRTLPDVTASGIEAPGSLWLTFDDGVTTVISTVHVSSGEAAEPVGLAAPHGAHVLGTQLPGGKRAFVLDAVSVGQKVASHVERIKSWLTEQGFDAVATDTTVTPALYKNIKDVAVLYLAAHGGVGVVQGKQVFVVSTSLPVSVDNLALYKSSFDVGEMGYMLAPVLDSPDPVARKGGMAASLFITPTFVRRYMSFQPGSLVYLGVCNAFSKLGDDFRKALMDTAHASVLLSWEKSVLTVGDTDSALYMFDRLLSRNSYKVYQASPPNRPFTVKEIFDQMTTRPRDLSIYGLNTDAQRLPHTLAQTLLGFELTDDHVSPPILSQMHAEYATGYTGFGLAPSITGLLLDNATNKLTLSGHFGNSPDEAGAVGPRQVTLDGLPLTVESWTPTLISLKDLPKSGAGFDGPVLVQVDGATSNPALLNEWDVVLRNYEPGTPPGAGMGSGARTVVECHITLRASGSAFRAAPDGELSLHASVNEAVVDNGSCTFDASGTGRGSNYSVTYSVAGSNVLPWLEASQRTNPGTLTRYAYVTGGISEGKVSFRLFAKIPVADGGGIRQTVNYDNGQNTETVTPFTSNGASDSGAFDAQHKLKADSYQQTLNLMTWGEAAPKRTEPDTTAR